MAGSFAERDACYSSSDSTRPRFLLGGAHAQQDTKHQSTNYAGLRERVGVAKKCRVYLVCEPSSSDAWKACPSRPFWSTFEEEVGNSPPMQHSIADASITRARWSVRESYRKTRSRTGVDTDVGPHLSSKLALLSFIEVSTDPSFRVVMWLFRCACRRSLFVVGAVVNLCRCRDV